jgi:starch synthase
MVTRLDEQKGVGITLDAFAKLKEKGIQLALLGAGAAELEQRATELMAKRAGRVAVQIGYDEQLAHLIYGSADTLLMPSLYEPCGLNQMYGLRYGTLPLVRRVGGLADTVVDASEEAIASGRATGFLFDAATPVALERAARRALEMHADPQRWGRLQAAAMAQRLTWAGPARQYMDLYRRLLPAD